MDHFAGLDVSVKVTSVCIVDGAGRIVREVKVASEPEALLAVLKNPAYLVKHVMVISPIICWAIRQPPRRCEPPLPEASRLALGQFAEA